MSSRSVHKAQTTEAMLAALPRPTPSYNNINDIIAMQKITGFKHNSNASPAQSLAFTAAERPRSIAGKDAITTPSWFRYANIDGENKEYGAVPEGYEWDVDYARRDDGGITTNPALTKIADEGYQRGKKNKARVATFMQSQAISEDELTEEGIEDVSSDEEMYTNNNRSFDVPSHAAAKPPRPRYHNKASLLLVPKLEPGSEDNVALGVGADVAMAGPIAEGSSMTRSSSVTQSYQGERDVDRAQNGGRWARNSLTSSRSSSALRELAQQPVRRSARQLSVQSDTKVVKTRRPEDALVDVEQSVSD